MKDKEFNLDIYREQRPDLVGTFDVTPDIAQSGNLTKRQLQIREKHIEHLMQELAKWIETERGNQVLQRARMNSMGYLYEALVKAQRLYDQGQKEFAPRFMAILDTYLEFALKGLAQDLEITITQLRAQIARIIQDSIEPAVEPERKSWLARAFGA